MTQAKPKGKDAQSPQFKAMLRGLSTTFPIRKQLVTIARSQVGVREVGGNNKGPQIRKYQAATWLEGTGWPYCAAFVCWCIREWIKNENVRAALKLTTAAKAEAWRPKTPAAFGFHDWAKENGLFIFDDSMEHVLHAGDIMVFDFSHIGIVETDKGRLVYTYEGNTGPSGGRDGDGVWDKVRDRGLARWFIRIMD